MRETIQGSIIPGTVAPREPPALCATDAEQAAVPSDHGLYVRRKDAHRDGAPGLADDAIVTAVGIAVELEPEPSRAQIIERIGPACTPEPAVITRASSVVKPMAVATLTQFFSKHMLAPLPRWATTTRPSVRLPSCCGRKLATCAYHRREQRKLDAG